MFRVMQFASSATNKLIALEDHVKSAKHVGSLKERKSTHQIDKHFEQYQDGFGEESKLSQEDGSSSAPSTSYSLVPMCGRIPNAEATVLGVMAENSMPMSYAPILVNLSKALAHDPKALAELHLDRTTAAYKMTHGLAESFHQNLISNLQKFPFSMNVDESTSNNHKKGLTVLVSYYNTSEENVMVEHWCSVIKLTVSVPLVFSLYNQDLPLNFSQGNVKHLDF